MSAIEPRTEISAADYPGLSDAARWLHLATGAASMTLSTPGFISFDNMPMADGGDDLAALIGELVEYGLWVELTSGYYLCDPILGGTFLANSRRDDEYRGKKLLGE
ncbi:hypothetical protein ACQBAU_16250 [Propionibacteriaceae bacterium Y2011]